jgi:Beta-lactamase
MAVIVGAERLPEGAGMDPDALGRAVDLIEARGAVAQVCVLRHDQVVLDRAFGCRPDSLFLTFSAGKPFVAVLVHLLAGRGQLDLDDPVARYWPEFGRHGKDTITIRQVLQHRAGLPVTHSLLRDAFAAPHWRRAVRGLELARPSSPPGAVPAYHILSFGFILGEVVQRVTGADVREVKGAPPGNRRAGSRAVRQRPDRPAAAAARPVVPRLSARRPWHRSGPAPAHGRVQQPGGVRPQRLRLLPGLGGSQPRRGFRLPHQPAVGQPRRLTAPE